MVSMPSLFPEPEAPLTVTELTRRIKAVLDAGFPDVLVRGEISNFKHHTSGHMYFTLKDAGDGGRPKAGPGEPPPAGAAGAVLRCVLFRREAARLGFLPENGMAVIARGRISVYERDGQYQLYVEELRPEGEGALQQAFLALRRKLEAEGLFDPARKRRLPPFVRRVGVVTSPTGAAVRDIVTVARRRFPGVEILLTPVLVQGPEAPPDIVRAIALQNAAGLAEVLIVGRGGGSLEELWAFNDERVARAIFASAIPVVSAVGHETDVTIADLVADVRAPTPSAAAELVVPDVRDLARQVDALRRRLEALAAERLTRARERLLRALARPPFARPLDAVRQWGQRVDDLGRRLAAATRLAVERARARRDLLVQKLGALSPLGVLARGYTLVRAVPDGAPVPAVAGLRPGQAIEVVFRDGEAHCEVRRTRRAE